MKAKVIWTVIILLVLAGLAWAQEKVWYTDPTTNTLSKSVSQKGDLDGTTHVKNVADNPFYTQPTLVLDACDSTSGWTAFNVDTTGLVTDLDHVLGSKSLEFDKVNGTSNTKYGAIKRSLSSVDISDYLKACGSINVSLNISTVAAVEYCLLRIGTSSSHYNEYRVEDEDLVTGWQSLAFPICEPSTAGNTGDGMDATDLRYLFVGCYFDLETSTLADLRIDNIFVKAGSASSGFSAIITAIEYMSSFIAAWDDGEDRASVNVEHHDGIDNCDATAGWTVLGNDTTTLALSANHVAGTGSLTFNKVDGAANTIFGGIQKTLASVEFRHYQAHNLVEWAVYASDLTNVAYAFLRLGDDSSNYSEWRVDDDDLTAGVWNPIAMLVGGVEYAVVGTGLDATDCDYVAVGVAFDLETHALAGIAIDEIHIHGNQHTTATLGEVTTTINTPNVNIHRLGGQPVDEGAGNVGNATQRTTSATDDVNLAALKVALEIIDDAYKIADDDDTGACHALGVASAQHTLTAAGWHTISCTGNSCPILCGANPTATAAANGHFIKIPDGAAWRGKLAAAKCAYLGGNGVAIGQVCFTYEGL